MISVYFEVCLAGFELRCDLRSPLRHLVFRQIQVEVLAGSVNVIGVLFLDGFDILDIYRLAAYLAQNLL